MTIGKGLRASKTGLLIKAPIKPGQPKLNVMVKKLYKFAYFVPRKNKKYKKKSMFSGVCGATCDRVPSARTFGGGIETNPPVFHSIHPFVTRVTCEYEDRKLSRTGAKPPIRRRRRLVRNHPPATNAGGTRFSNSRGDHEKKPQKIKKKLHANQISYT